MGDDGIPVITLITDFGLEDPYVGIMKGVILNIQRDCRIVDISHGIASQDILAGALALNSSFRFFPKGTIHVAVVDPGVGSSRRPILAQTEDYFFVGPDNGILSPALEREKELRVYHLIQDRFFLKPMSHTFHGRDVFAPVAGWLSKGTLPCEFGPRIQDFLTLKLPLPKRMGQRVLGTILRIDKFGNLITNLTARDLPEPVREYSLRIAGHQIRQHLDSYAEAEPKEPFTIFGSSGYLEISVNRGSAASLLKVCEREEFVLERFD
jgi:S-adenosyl-L-methionine hydrolase (adenosine-forming)